MTCSQIDRITAVSIKTCYKLLLMLECLMHESMFFFCKCIYINRKVVKMWCVIKTKFDY